MGSRALEITVISGEGLRVNRRRPVKKNAFVVVRTDPRNATRTRMDADGGSYPAWNEKLVVEMQAHERFVTVEVQCKTNLGEKCIGTARIPASDFVGGYVPENYLHFLSYRLRDCHGDRNGIINLSVRVKVPENASCAASHPQPWMVAPAIQKASGGVVTGVPVWGGYQV